MSETVWRLSIFAGALILFSCLEALFPRRARDLPRQGRWLTHLGITVIDSRFNYRACGFGCVDF